MRVVPLQLQGKGVLDFQVAAEISGLISGKWKGEEEEGGVCHSAEPTSVLERGRSPSPQTSASVLSASLGGGTGSNDTAGVAAVPDHPLNQWPPPSQEDNFSATPPAVASDMSSAGRREGDKCSADGGGWSGFGMDEWEGILTEQAVASPGNDHSFLRVFMGDVDEPSLKQLLQSGSGGGGALPEFEGGDAGFGAALPFLGFEGKASGHMTPPPLASVSTPGFALNFSNLDYPNSNLKPPFHVDPQNLIFSSASNPPQALPLSSAQLGFHHHHHQQQIESLDEKPLVFNAQILPNQQPSNSLLSHQNPPLFIPSSFPQHHPPQLKRRCPNPFPDCSQELLLDQQPGFFNEHLIPDHSQIGAVKMKTEVGGPGDDGNQHCALVDQLIKAADLIQNGNFAHARGILARLNHISPVVGKPPLQRAIFYFKEALQLLLGAAHCGGGGSLPSSFAFASPLDVVFKISAYKVFSEISPIPQFVNFTSNQVILEALEGFDQIHIVDFDIGIGGQWASFMQELSMRAGRHRTSPSLKITVFASSSSHHPLEISLTQDNLTHFASGLNIPFQFNVINVDAIVPSEVVSLGASMTDSAENVAVAVNFPVGSSNLPIPLFLPLLKQISPKIVVSADHGCMQSEFPYSQHILHALQSYSVLFNSLDSMNVNSDAVLKIERFLLWPRIESIVLGRSAGEKLPSWRALFTSAGFSPIQFSNLAEMQGVYLVKRFQGRGFHVESRQASLYLCWQKGGLCSVSAWRC